jgi:leader peptidase (prepilin peptidase)/N-methyltransferase
MIIAILVVLGLCAGSFINALVWRIHEQAHETDKDKPNKRYQARLSLTKGRSMCPHCKHDLAVRDLVPVISWLSLRGKCRYCHKPIAAQYPLVEVATVLLFIASYVWWPIVLHGSQSAIFVLWLALLVGLIALIVYDVRWLLLPDRLIYPLGVIASVQAIIAIVAANRPLVALLNTLVAVVIGGGIFYIIFQVSDGQWIGGGDVKLGWLLGLIVATPARSLLFIFIAAACGSLVSLPLLATGKLKRTSVVPFGPLLIIGAVIVVLFGANILHWYQQSFITF